MDWRDIQVSTNKNSGSRVSSTEAQRKVRSRQDFEDFENDDDLIILEDDSNYQNANTSTVSRVIKRPRVTIKKSKIVNAFLKKNPQTDDFNMNFSNVFYTPGCGFMCIHPNSSKMPNIEKPFSSKTADNAANKIVVYDESDEELEKDSFKGESAGEVLVKMSRVLITRRISELTKELRAKQKQSKRQHLPRFKLRELENAIAIIKKEIKSLENQLDPQRCSKCDSSDNQDEDGERGGDNFGLGDNFGFGDDFEDLLHEVFDGGAATVQGLHDLKDTLSRCPGENEVAPDPVGLRVPLLIHQKKALKWMLFREEEKCCGGLLADDMGLGKTLTMISLILQTMPPREIFGKIEYQNEVKNDSTSDYIESDEELESETPKKLAKEDKHSPEITYNGGTLVVCPLSLLQQWKTEIATRVERGLITVKIHHGPDRVKDPQELVKFDVIITTIHILKSECGRKIGLFKVNWKRVVLDEAHIVRNPETSMSQSACSLSAEKRWALTGTPVQNKPLDLFALLKFLRCSPWDDIKVWRTTMKSGKEGVKPLTTVLKSLVLRRTKKELQESGEMPPLPSKTTRDIEIEMEESQAKVYRTMLAYSKTLFEKFLLQRKRKKGISDYDAEKRVHDAMKKKDLSLCEKDDVPKELLDEFNKVLLGGEKIQQFHILVLLLRLRQICNHPALLNKMVQEEEMAQGLGADGETKTENKKKKTFNALFVSKNKDNPMTSDNPVLQEKYRSAKINKIFEILNEVIPTGEKIVIISQWTSMLKIIEYHLSYNQPAEWEMFSGEVQHRDRQDIVDRFNDPRSDLKILLLSLTAGGVGLNLMGGNHILLVDNHWNPQLENQAQDRIYRYGQNKPVTVYKFLCSGTIEERVKELQEEKLMFAKEIFSGLKMTSTRLTLNDLKKLFQIKSNARPPAETVCGRRVRPRLENLDSLIQDHDYVLAPQAYIPPRYIPQESVPQEFIPQENIPQEFIPQESFPQESVQEAADVPEFDFAIYDVPECEENFSKNARDTKVDSLLENIENDLNQINKSNDIPIRASAAFSPILESAAISTQTPLSPKIFFENKPQSTPLGNKNATIDRKNATSTPLVGNFLPKPMEMSGTFSLGIPRIPDSQREENVSQLEDDLDSRCNKAIDAIRDIKNIWANCGIVEKENSKPINTFWIQPSCSKISDLNNNMNKSISALEEKKSTDDTGSDDNLPPDVSKFLNSGANIVNAKRSSLISRISQLENDIQSDRNKLNRSCLKFAKRNPLEKLIRDRETRLRILKADFAATLKASRFSTTNAAIAKGVHELQQALSGCPEDHEFAEDPLGLRVKLMLHQKKALKWMLQREGTASCPGGILADDMGLGKTLTMIALIVHSIPIERRQNSASCGLDSADSGDDWDAPIVPKSKKRVKTQVYEKFTIDGGTLVVCPPTLLQQWENEIKKRTNSGLLKVLIHHGANRTRDPRELCRPDIVLTTYTLLHQDCVMLNKVYWKRVVLDEAHQIRNPKTNVSESACMLKSPKRWAMTGTPVHNRPLDIYAILKFLGCHPWDDIRIWNSTMRGSRAGIMRITTLLKSLVMRRTKGELQASGEMPPLPPRIVETIEIELDEEETQVYKTLLAYSRTMFAQFLMQRDRRAGRFSYTLHQLVHSAKKNSRVLTKDDNIPQEIFDELNKALLNTKGVIQQYHILVLLLRLRQICNHPALISRMIEDEEITQLGVNEDSQENQGDLFRKDILSNKNSSGSLSDVSQNPMRSDNPVFQEDYESSKMKAIMETVNRIMPTGDKVIIVSQWTCMLELIKDHLKLAGESRYAMFTGQVKVSERQAIVDRFNDQKDCLKILFLSLTAGGQGLNLFGANHLIMVDNHWNPQLEKQAQDRIYRYGQEKKVKIYKFLCKDTIEERVKDLQDRKLKLADDILNGISLTSTKLTLEDLKQLFQMR
ncbi:uncharacterized protein LOC117175343 [Belonocnema kinseyi]|uniref:uncharacterized protein LOC117175343 n=1 Tax=Belonocnema kinseyi TaxID=2817044 RepID=UPI00143CFFDC|nr:uncharacterized protein LOC117175343 [Belonocnema kinseyi]